MANILVVDDDPSARDLIVTLLGYVGHTVVEASDGMEGLSAVRAHAPELVIADLVMPTMDGFEFVRRLRTEEAFAATPVVFYSASYLASEALSLANACGVKHIITKPADPEQIIRTVSEALGEPKVPAAVGSLGEFQREHVDVLTDKLWQRANPSLMRLGAMIELGLQLVPERNPQRLLGKVCAEARNIIGAKYGLVGVFRDTKLRFACTSGMTREVAAQVCASDSSVASAHYAPTNRQAFRSSHLSGNPQLVGLPLEHPPVHSFLAAPILSPDRVYGWLLLTDKLGAAEFGEEDQGLAQILAAQVGRIYENSSLDEEIKRHVQQLEAEVAERKRAQDEVNRLNEQLEQRVAKRTAELEAANKELESFSYTVSHDLRAPLRVIGGFSDMLLADYQDALPEKAKGLLRRIRVNVERMGQLIDDLLTFARLSQKPLRETLVRTTRLVELALEEMPKNEDRKVDLRVGLLADCFGDQSLLRQVWVNLLSNAFKFTRERPLAVIEIGCQRGAGENTYFVRDDGVGFDVRHANKLFGVFQRLHSARDFEGTGIGLSIVKKIVERHGGRVWGEGAPGRGATFYFTLPTNPPAHKSPSSSH